MYPLHASEYRVAGKVILDRIYSAIREKNENLIHSTRFSFEKNTDVLAAILG